jgi:hypothetical protein
MTPLSRILNLPVCRLTWPSFSIAYSMFSEEWDQLCPIWDKEPDSVKLAGTKPNT